MNRPARALAPDSTAWLIGWRERDDRGGGRQAEPVVADERGEQAYGVWGGVGEGEEFDWSNWEAGAPAAAAGPGWETPATRMGTVNAGEGGSAGVSARAGWGRLRRSLGRWCVGGLVLVLGAVAAGISRERRGDSAVGVPAPDPSAEIVGKGEEFGRLDAMEVGSEAEASGSSRLALYQRARAALDVVLGPAGAGDRQAFLDRPGEIGLLPEVVAATGVRHLSTDVDPVTRRCRTIFCVESDRHAGGIKVVFEHGPDGPKTSAAALAEQWDRRLEGFLAGEGTSTAELSVMLSRAHSFEPGAPDAERFICVCVHGPMVHGAGARIFASRTSAEGALIEKRLVWGRHVPAVVRLERAPADPTGGVPEGYVRLGAVLSAEW